MKPRLWAGLAPFGIGRTKPHHYVEMARAAWDNRHAPLYAWRILSRGVCDGCALGVSGFRDWTIEGIHKRTPSAGNSPSHSCVGTDDRLVITTAVRTPTPDPVYLEGEA